MASVAPRCPALTLLNVSGMDSHFFTLLYAHADWLPKLATLTYHGSPGRDPTHATLHRLLAIRPLLHTLRFQGVPRTEVGDLRRQLARYRIVTITNPIARYIIITIT
jgi:hypothetical protein